MTDASTTLSIAMIADDFGLGPAIDGAILDLAQWGRITGLSCMTATRRWPDAAKILTDLPRDLSVGLHLTLTALPNAVYADGMRPARPDPGPLGLLAQGLRGRIDRTLLSARITAQIDRFEAALGRPPDHVDGHEHVHAMPIVRDVVLDVLTRRGLADRLWIRSVRPVGDPHASFGAMLRHRLFAALASGHERGLGRDRVAASARLAGIRAFSATEDYSALLARQLRRVTGPGVVVMCHPARPEPRDPNDDIQAARIDEYRVLSGPDFPEILKSAGLRLGRPSSQ